MRELTNTRSQKLKHKKGRSLSEIQRDLEQKDVKGFVVYMSPSNVTVLADRDNYLINRRNWNGQD